MALVFPVGENSPGLVKILNRQCMVLSQQNSDELGGSDETVGGDWDQDPFISKVFFLSETSLFCDGLVYNLRTRRFKPLFRSGLSRLKCVTGVPHRRHCAFFQSRTGLELWNISARRRVRQWPTIRRARDIYFTPDTCVMAVRSGRGLEFWHFDPTVCR